MDRISLVFRTSILSNSSIRKERERFSAFVLLLYLLKKLKDMAAMRICDLKNSNNNFELTITNKYFLR